MGHAASVLFSDNYNTYSKMPEHGHFLKMSCCQILNLFDHTVDRYPVTRVHMDHYDTDHVDFRQTLIWTGKVQSSFHCFGKCHMGLHGHIASIRESRNGHIALRGDMHNRVCGHAVPNKRGRQQQHRKAILKWEISPCNPEMGNVGG